MRLWLCQIFPPLAILLCGKPFTALLNLFLVVWPWASSIEHAEEVVDNYLQDGRFRKLKAPGKRDQSSRSREPYPPSTYTNPRRGANGTRFRRR